MNTQVHKVLCNFLQNMLLDSLRIHQVDNLHILEWEDSQNYCLLQDIIQHKHEYQDYHKILDRLSIFERINEEECRQINLKDKLVNIFSYCWLQTIHRDKFQHNFLWYCLQKFPVNNYKRIYEWNYQHSNQDCLDIEEHKFLMNYQPKLLVSSGTKSHISMLNYQHMYLEKKDICPKHMFSSYYQPNYLMGNY